MEDEGLSSSRGNPRFPQGDRPLRPALVAEPQPPPGRPLLTILDRFRAMLRERGEELREATGEDPPPPPTAGEIVQLYEELISELTFNSKPIITELTIIAGQHLQFAEGIADAICARVLEVFCEVYNQVHRSEYPAMRHLFGTWFQVFPLSVLRRIEDKLQFSPSKNSQSSRITSMRHFESPSPCPSHGIHVNPKYLEAQHLFKHSTMMSALDSHDKAHMTDFDGEQMEGNASEGLKGWTLNMPEEFLPVYKFMGRNLPCNATRKRTSLEKLPKVQRLDVNGIASETATRKWKNSEEEEYVWEDMSPTLSDRSRRKSQPPLGLSTGSLSIRGGLPRPDASLLEHDFGRHSWPGQAQLPAIDDPAHTVEDRIHFFGSAHGEMNRKYLDGMVNQNKFLPHGQGSHQTHEPQKLPYMFPQSSQQSLGPQLRGRAPQMPVAASGITPPVGNKLPNLYENTPDMEVAFQTLSSSHSDPFNVDTSTLERYLPQRPHSPPHAPIVWPPVHKSQLLPLLPIPPNQKQFKSPFDFLEAYKPLLNQGPESSFYFSQHQNDTADRKNSNLNKLLQVPYQQPGIAHENRQGVAMVSVLPNPSSRLPSSVAVNNMPDTSLHVDASILPPLPPGPPPASSQMGPVSQTMGSVVSSSTASAFSSLISSLMAQGLISLNPPAQSQDSVGVEFNAELLKARRESAINALYTDLPRQCTTCGLHFKRQEEHSSHMDWHVTKNRISKYRKQSHLADEAVTEKKEDKEMAVPADENQTVCALCGEPFEDFYSDDIEEWMYKGTVYLNAPEGYSEGLDRLQLGPIVHAKCRSESMEGSGQA
ncbi:hypothetical protein COCNU_12G003420 [Cocos nucifera]|uniref:C2H2-type domain-containing protein n=1 Tax=Cocos nucifera TaxID=13894 RepID=A0A8K0NAB0_COCNU|nr:hypothetical protein COCNU_12G003420 [Cocos nucifera]